MKRGELLLAGTILGALVLGIMAANITPQLPDRDAGVFLYAGQRILHGDIPYRDFWDHKGPLIYYINAVGLVLAGGSEAGVWALEVLAVGVAAILGYAVIRREFGEGPALVGSALWLATVSYSLWPGNYTEEFGLPLQFGALILFIAAEQGSKQRRMLFGVGIMTALLLLLRPNLGGVPLSILFFLVADGFLGRRVARRVADCMAVCLGAGLVLGAAGAYFAAHGALGFMWDAVVAYNKVYVHTGLLDRVNAVTEGLHLLAPGGLAVLGLIGWSRGVWRWIFDREAARPSSIMSVALIGLVVEFLMVAVAGRSLNHYYTTWVPVLSLLCASVVCELLTRMRATSPRRQGSRWAVAGMLAATCALPVRDMFGGVVRLMTTGPRDAGAIAQEIVSVGGETEALLMWGAESAFNFLLDIPAPTRYVYQYPLYTCGYTSGERLGELAMDIRESLPLIVDSSSSNALVPPIDSGERAVWLETKEGCSLTDPMEELLARIDDSYELVGVTPTMGWKVYRHR